ncbi:MAG: ATP-binding protein [Bryobacteraceae bacterium]
MAARVWPSRIDIEHDGECVARHQRCYGRSHQILNLEHHLDVLEKNEVGYVPLADIGAEFLFQVISERTERAALIVTTNLPFSEWTTVFPDDSEAHVGARRHAIFRLAPTLPVHLRCEQFLFTFVYSRTDIEACLRCVLRHLAPTGRFIVEVFNPALGLLVRPPDHRSSLATYEDGRSEATVTVSKSVHYDSPSQISYETWYFRDESTGKEEAVPLNLRMFFPQEIDAVLHYNGFSIEQKYGGYTEQPFDPSSRKQIIVSAANGRVP